MVSSSILAAVASAGWIVCSVATDITVYKDADCSVSQQNINGPNGYTDGTCTSFNQRVSGNWSSFQVVDVDEGCGVTIYGSNSETGNPCSSTALQIAEIATCYNTSWIYYSIDNCVRPLSASASASSTSSATSKSSSNSSSTPTGAIVGGVIGGVAGVAIIIGAGVFFWRRKKAEGGHTGGSEEAAAAELHGADRKVEMAASDKPTELIDPRTPVEMEGDVGFGTRTDNCR